MLACFLATNYNTGTLPESNVYRTENPYITNSNGSCKSWFQVMRCDEPRIGSKRWFRVIISIEILKTTKVVVVRQWGYVERWKCWLNRIWTRNLNWYCKKVLSTIENFWIILGQSEVCTMRDCFQTTTDNISSYFKRRTMVAEAERIWIDGSHHQAYAFASLLSCLLCHNKERLNV